MISTIRRLQFIAMSLVLVLVLAACGGGESEPVEEAGGATEGGEAATPSGDDPFAELAAAAEAEGGQLDYYFILGEEALRPVFEAFTERYPFVNVEVTGGDPMQLIERLVSEAQAERSAADVLQGGPMEDLIINTQSDLGMEYMPEGLSEVPEELRFEGQFVVPDYFTFQMVYNTNEVTEEEAPRSLEDLTQPDWRGRFGIDAEQLDWFAGEMAYYGEEEGLALMEQLAANDAQVFAGTAGYEQLAAGGLDVIVNTFSQLLVPYIQQGAPIAIADQDHVIAQPDIYIPLANTDSPNTTKLYLEWLFTPEAQEVLSQGTFKTPVLEGVDPPEPMIGVCDEGCELFFETSENFGDFNQRAQQFQDLFVAE